MRLVGDITTDEEFDDMKAAMEIFFVGDWIRELVRHSSSSADS